MIKSAIFIVLSALPLISSASPTGIDYPVNKNQIIVEDHFIGSAEPNVIDALWTDKHVFKVAMSNDGTSRDGYAQYVCQILYKHDYRGKGVLVRVVDYTRLIKTGDWVNMGTAQCK